MIDLLNEDEFSPKVYSPNRWFGRFYIGAFIFEITAIVMSRLITLDNNALSISVGIFTGFILPLSLSMVMIFTKKEILLDTKKSKIIAGIFILQMCFLIPWLINMVSNYFQIYLFEGDITNFWILLIPITIRTILYGITLAIIMPLINRSRKIKDHPLP
ncbi:hypothetical protein [Flavobacterium psychrotrophum]|uniref:hypothetical protein n=1 Tax=Flavobacterium psychrotrophum TaxID=2294119 RepID=UPI000E314F67|nr:hypothetical protein [Flavobacterium psychrotrophum]